jgi:hypothetical protein
VRAQDGEMLPRRYSRLAHLMGEYAGCPVMMRVRDIHRAGGFAASLYDLTLRLAEIGRGEAHELLLMSTERPRALAAEEYEPIARAAIDRLGLDWSARGWPAKIESQKSGLESAVLALRRRLIARRRYSQVIIMHETLL